MLDHHTHSPRTARPAQAVVEFALALPVLVLMLAGIYDLANGYQTYIALTNAAREGAHWGIAHATDTSGICTHVNQTVPAGVTATCNVYYATNADGSCAGGGTATVGGPVCVSVSYSLPTLMGAVLGFNTIPITTYATMIVFSK